MAGVDTLDLAKKAYLPNSKSDVDKLDVDKLASVPPDSSKLSDVVNKRCC